MQQTRQAVYSLADRSDISAFHEARRGGGAGRDARRHIELSGQRLAHPLPATEFPDASSCRTQIRARIRGDG